MLKRLDYAAFVAYLALIFWLSNQPKLPTPNWFEFEDKLHHYVAYFMMTIFAIRAFRHIAPLQKHLIWFGVLFSSLYGISDEIHQIFTPNRSPSVYDWLADTTGALFAAWAWSWLAKKISKA